MTFNSEVLKLMCKLPRDIIDEIFEYNADHKPLMESLMIDLMLTYMKTYDNNILYCEEKFNITDRCFDKKSCYYLKKKLIDNINDTYCCAYCDVSLVDTYETDGVKCSVNMINRNINNICIVCKRSIDEYYEELYYQEMLQALEDEMENKIDMLSIKYFRNMRI